MSRYTVYSLGGKTFLGYLAFLSAFAPLSTDLYLPALPAMAKAFGVSPDLMNLSLSGFFIFFGLSMLAAGPLSDKYGRRPLLLIGGAIFTLASIGCALAPDAWSLIGFRCLQACGSGILNSLVMSLAKDVFRGRVMESVLALIQILMGIMPMLAPLIGGLLLSVTSWRGLFWAFTGCGIIAFAGTLPLGETCRKRLKMSVWHAFGRIPAVLRDPGFSSLLVIFSAIGMAFFVYIGTSPYIYQGQFQVSPLEFSCFFAANALITAIGPIIYVRFLRGLPKVSFITGLFAISLAASLLVLVLGGKGPLWFACLYAPIGLCWSACKPYATTLMLSQRKSDNGTMAACIAALNILFGSLAMTLCALPWHDPVTATGVIAASASLLCLVGWLWASRRRLYHPLESITA